MMPQRVQQLFTMIETIFFNRKIFNQKIQLKKIAELAQKQAGSFKH